MGTVAEERLPNHALGVEGPRIQIDSIMSVQVPSGEKCSTSTDKCKHFTIRGFVSGIRSKGNKIYSPFVSDGETNRGNENNFRLPHMQVHSFRRWKCNRCLDQDVESSQGTTSTVAAAVASRSPRSGYDEIKIFPSRRPSKKRSTSNATHDLHMVGSSSQTVETEVMDTAQGKSHMKEGLMAPPRTLVSGKGMRSHSQKSPRRHFLQEHSYSRGSFDGHLNLENSSFLQFTKEGYSREIGSSSQGTSPAMTPLLSNAISCGNFSSSGQKLENRLVEDYSSLSIPMARLNGFTKGKSTSQKPASLQGASIEVSFSPTNIPGDGKSSSLKLSHDRPRPKSGSDQGTSRGSVMGPPRSYPHGKNYSSQKKPKENGLQIGKRHYAKRTMQPQDNAEGCGVVSKDPSVQEVLLPSAVTQEGDHVQESVSPKSTRTREVGSKGKGVENISSDNRSKVLLAKINQPASDASSLFGTCRDGKAETCTEVAKIIGPHNMLTEHSVPSLEESNSGGSTSGHVDDDDDDDDDDNDEDYKEEDEEDESRWCSRPRRAPKIISLKKVMDKAHRQNAQSSMNVGGKNRKRKNRSQDMVYPGLRNSNDSPSSGSKRIATPDIRRANIITSRKRDVIKRTLHRPDPEKNKKLKPNKSYVSSVRFQEKFELERCHEKGPQKKRTSKDKAEGGNKKRGKRKADVPGTRDRSPTSSKGMQSGDGETEIELRKVVHPDSMNLVSQCKEKILEENTAENTTSSLTVKGDGGDKAMRKGKEKLVDVVEVAENSMLHLRGSGEGSSSLANDEIEQADGRGKVKDFDINVPAEEVLMDIVELMAKNQLERTRDDVVDKPIIMQEPVISQSRGFYPTDSMAVYNTGVDRSHPLYGIYVKPPADYPGFGFAKTGPVGSVRQLSEYFVEAHKSTLQVGYPNDNLSSNARFAGSYAPQCPDQVPGQARYSSVGSMGGSWSHNTLAYKAPDNNNIMQQGSSFTRYQGGISSSPLNSPTWPPSKPAVIRSQVPVGGGLVNQQMFSLDSAPFKGPQNNQISGSLNFDLFARDRQKNSTASPYSPNVEAISEHSYGCGKHQMINYLPLKATGPEDFSSNDVIPALQLLNIMHSGQSRSNRPLAAEVNGNRIVSSTSHSVVEPSYHQYSKQYMAGSHRHFEGCLHRSSDIRHLPVYETRGGRSTSSVEKLCPNYANLATHHELSNSSLFLRGQTCEKKSNAGYANPLSFPSHAQRGRFGNSAQSSSQVVDFRAQKPLNHVPNLDREHQWVPAISKGLTGYGGPSRWSLEALNSLKNQPRPRNGTLARSEQLASLLTPSTEVCVVNRNPAEFIDPREASKFTIKSEDLRRSVAKRTQMVY